MTDITVTDLINALASASSVLSSDTTIVVTGGSAKKVTVSEITDTKNLVVTSLVVLSEETEFPAASATDIYQVTSDGWIGGVAGSGLYVNENDLLYCNTTTEAGSYAAVGQYWNIIRFIIAQPDGYRYIDSLSNTEAPTGITNGLYWLDNELYKVEDGIATKLVAGNEVVLINISWPEKPLDSGVISLRPPACTIPTDLTGSTYHGVVDPAAEAVVTLKKSGITFGTATVAAGSTDVMTGSSTETSFNGTTDRLDICFPAQDADWSGVLFAFQGVRS